MFTGIIEAVGEIKKVAGNHFTVSHPFGDVFKIGESVCLSGMCTTVISKNEADFTVEIIGQSRDLTTFGSAKVGHKINLERSAVVGHDRNAGHYVTGHIDGVAVIDSIQTDDDYIRVRVALPRAFAHLVVEKGSVTLDGIALTVAALGEAWYEVCIISHTWTETTLCQRSAGDALNVEYDLMAKYRTRREALNALYDGE